MEMLLKARSAKVRTAIAVLVGIPSTLLYGVLIGFVLFLVADSGQFFLREFLLVLWCLAGIGGFAGFGGWVFSSRPISMPAKVVMTLLMLAGEIAACLVVFGYNENVPQRALAAVDMVVGIIICLWLWLPNFPLNPDAPPRQGAG